MINSKLPGIAADAPQNQFATNTAGISTFALKIGELVLLTPNSTASPASKGAKVAVTQEAAQNVRRVTAD
jgi:hypothetical protein